MKSNFACANCLDRAAIELFLKSSAIIAARKAIRKRIAGRESVKRGRLPKRVGRPVRAEMVEKTKAKAKGRTKKVSPKERGRTKGKEKAKTSTRKRRRKERTLVLHLQAVMGARSPPREMRTEPLRWT